jgi:hypothetical protein
MPWELGYADGLGKKAATIPVVPTNAPGIDDTEFRGQEYLGVYPYVVESHYSRGTMLWVHHTATKFESLREWLGV